MNATNVRAGSEPATAGSTVSMLGSWDRRSHPTAARIEMGGVLRPSAAAAWIPNNTSATTREPVHNPAAVSAG